MAAPNGRGYRLIADYRAANAEAELVPWPLPDLEAMVSRVSRVQTLRSLDLLQGYRKMMLKEETQDWFTIALSSGL